MTKKLVYVVSPSGKVHLEYGWTTKCKVLYEYGNSQWRRVTNAGEGYTTRMAMLNVLCKRCYPNQAELLKA